MNKKWANILSILGHPLLTIPFFLVIILFNYEQFDKAITISALIIGSVFVPISAKMYWGSKKGIYTNFDISDKNQRQSWYLILLFLLVILMIILIFTNQAQILKLNVSLFILLLLTSTLLNYYIKSSLHVSLNIFLSFLIIPFNITFGLLFLFFTLLVAWSRIVLKRHTLIEVIYGAIIGSLVGFISLVNNNNLTKFSLRLLPF